MAIAEYEPYYLKSKALIVGVNTYTDPNLPTLYEAEEDAEILASLLKSPKYGFEVTLLLGRRATKKAILERLHKLRATSIDDRLLVYFACHGYTRTDNFDNEKGYIAVADTNTDKEFTALGLDEVTEIRFFSNAKHIGFIFDTCFSGQALGLTRQGSVTIEKFLSRRAYQVITAGTGDQTVVDFRSMTRLMVDAIQNESASNSGLTTLNSLGLFLQQTMTADTRKTQIPQFGHLKGSQGGDLIISISNQQQVATSPKAKLISDISQKSIQSFPQKGVYAADVDLIGRIEDTSRPTVITISAGLSVTLWIAGSVKEEAIKKLKESRPHWGPTRTNVFLYSTLLYLLLKDHIHKLDLVTIDTEYSGYEWVIKKRIMDLCRNYGKPISKNKIRFSRVEKTSLARMMATRVYKGNSIPDWRITVDEVLSI
jgi:hypothetical protein